MEVAGGEGLLWCSASKGQIIMLDGSIHLYAAMATIGYW